MSISIWWLIGFLQITVGISIACLFYAYSAKISKNQCLDLKNLLENTVQDYNDFASKHTATPQAEPTEAAVSEAQLVLEKTYERCLALYNDGMETLPDWEPTTQAQGFAPEQLRVAIEIHISHLLQEQNTKALAYWEAFAASLAQFIETEAESARSAQHVINTMYEQWMEKKPKLQGTFDTLVTTAQQTELSGQIHEPLNDLYNEFIAILNGLPNLKESSQDALLKMEPAVNPATSPPALDSVDDLPEDLVADELEIDILEEDTPSPMQATDPSGATDISPDTILPLSQYALEDEEDQLEKPASAIPDFDEPEPTPTPASTPTPVAPEPSEAPIVDDSGIDDDMFDDLLSTMDDVIEGTDNPDSTANG